MKLSKEQRAELHARYKGRCAYCGEKLGQRWHADHIEPVGRQGKWVREGRTMKHVATGILDHPERDVFSNLTPSCHLCNISKANLSLESWRSWLARVPETFARNHGPFRHALRLGIVIVPTLPVIFHFERRPRIRYRSES
jgi:hypothetical protein